MAKRNTATTPAPAATLPAHATPAAVAVPVGPRNFAGKVHTYPGLQQPLQLGTAAANSASAQALLAVLATLGNPATFTAAQVLAVHPNRSTIRRNWRRGVLVPAQA